MSDFKIEDSSLTGLSGKVVFITGGSSGIGLATAHTFLALNARVIVGDLNPPVESIANLKYVSCDITNWSSLCSAVQETVSEYGRLDVFVANAGVGEVEDFFSEEIDPTTGMLKAPKHTVVEVNLKGTMNCAKVAVSQMRKQETGGAIVFTASTAAYLDERGIPAYTAAKHGVLGLMRAMRSTVPKLNITVNIVAPWMTDSALLSDHHKGIMASCGVPVNDPQNVGRAIAYLSTGLVNGKALWTGRNVFTEMEDALTRLQPEWLGEENTRAWNKANEQDFFHNESGI